ncbi:MULTISPECIES: hypothetical protein [Halomonas]|uniref:Uncharacterized protein n=1 Tax=Halomonas ventosae TaxID=229007 RepID=A0A4R6HDL6_9GAMM|nr:hypothetical protein [Halomonas ventosae]TDO06713.1 hypothetical protein DFO68_11061 [Halomonas ventosae]
MLQRTPLSTGARHPRLLRLLIILTLLTLAVALWYLTRYSLRDEAGVQWYPPLETPCDLHSAPCTARLGQGITLRLAIESDGPIRALERLPLEVSVAGIPASAARVDFVGRDMDMGLHRFPLEAAGSGVFRGEGQVAICTKAVMPWRAKVVVDTPQGRLGSWFDFEVARR